MLKSGYNAQTHPVCCIAGHTPRDCVSCNCNTCSITMISNDGWIYMRSRCTNVKINFREKEKEVLDQILGNPGRYDARIRPSGVNGTGEFVNFS